MRSKGNVSVVSVSCHRISHCLHLIIAIVGISVWYGGTSSVQYSRSPVVRKKSKQFSMKVIIGVLGVVINMKGGRDGRENSEVCLRGPARWVARPAMRWKLKVDKTWTTHLIRVSPEFHYSASIVWFILYISVWTWCNLAWEQINEEGECQWGRHRISHRLHLIIAIVGISDMAALLAFSILAVQL